MYSENINVRYSELDFDKSLKPFSLLNFFQDIASDNAESLGFGYSNIYPQNLMWVLIKYRIEFNEYPIGLHNLLLKTEPRGCNKIFAYRNFELSDGDKILARASSMWSLVDIDTLTAKNIESVISSEFLPKHQQQENDLQFNKIPVLTQTDFEKEFEVRYNDLDVNKHANNGNYIVWAIEPLDFDFRLNNKLKTIDMMFKKEIKYGEKLISKVQKVDEKTTLHALKHRETGEDLCVLLCKWENK